MGLEKSSPALIIIYNINIVLNRGSMILHISTRTLQTKQLVIILYVDKPGNHNVHIMILSFVKD